VKVEDGGAVNVDSDD